MPCVSVIVPNYNHARFLRRRIDTILAQTFQDFELILLDDCSTDGSRAILREYASDPRVRVEFNEVNSGSTFKQWNKGVRLAHGEYGWIAESDDYAEKRLLERLVRVLENDPAITFTYCRSWNVSDDDRLKGFADYYLDYLDPCRWKTDFCVNGLEECQHYLVSTNTVPNASAVVFRRAAYNSVGGADESLRICGDWRLWAAMALQGKMAYLGEPLNYFRSHGASVRNKSREEALDVVEYLRVTRWILDRVTPTDNVLKGVYKRQAGFWVPALASTTVPFSSKLEILEAVRSIDPHPIERALRTLFWIVRRECSRYWQSLRSSSAATGS